MAHLPSSINLQTVKKKRKSSEARLNITSMMDLMTIILLFLLKSYDAEGNLPQQADGLKLPLSFTEKQAKSGLSVVITQDIILVEKDPVAKTKDILDRIKTEPGSYMIEALFNDLTARAENAKQLEADYGTKFKGEVAVQIDGEIPFEILTRVMYTCGQSGFVAMKLTVFMKG